MSNCNIDIRETAKKNGIFLYEIAKKLHLQDANFSRKLRYELTNEEKEKIFAIIEEIKKAKN